MVEVGTDRASIPCADLRIQLTLISTGCLYNNTDFVAIQQSGDDAMLEAFKLHIWVTFQKVSTEMGVCLGRRRRRGRQERWYLLLLQQQARSFLQLAREES